MSTYIQGLTDTPITPIQTTPDFNLVANALSHKDAMYQEGMKKVSGQYQSLLRDLSNPDNIQTRDAYAKEATKELTRLVSDTDLSLPQNSSQAERIFAPFWEDKDLLYDWAATKTAQKNIEQGYSYLNSKDEKNRNKFSQLSIQYIQNGLDKLKRARRGDGSIQEAAEVVMNRRYVPNYDIMGYLKDQAGKDGLNIEYDVQMGNYIMRYKNSDKTAPAFETWVKTALESNQSAMDMFRIQGTVEYENNLKQFINAGYDESAAKNMMALSYIDNLKKAAGSGINAYNTKITDLSAKIKGFEDLMKSAYKGQVPTDPDGQRKYEEYLNDKKLLDITQTELEEKDALVKDYSDPNSQKYQDAYRMLNSGGEEYYQNGYFNTFVKSAAQSLRIQSGISSKVQMDPVDKYQAQLAEKYAEMGNKNSDKKTKTETTIMPTGITPVSNDVTTVHDRMEQIAETTKNEFINLQKRLIQNYDFATGANTINSDFLDGLITAINTGQFPTGKLSKQEYEDELKELKSKGIIPADGTYSLRNPSKIFSALSNYAKTYFKQFGDKIADVAILQDMDKMYDLATINESLSKVKKEADAAYTQYLSENPNYSKFIKDGKFITKADYLKQQTGVKDEDEIGLTSYSGALGFNKLITIPMFDRMKADVNKAADDWEKANQKYNEALSAPMKKYLSLKGAFQGKNVLIKGNLVNKITDQIFSDPGMMSQGVDKESAGIPINMSVFTNDGVSEETILSIVNKLRADASSINTLEYTQLGRTGVPSVIIRPTLDVLKGEEGDSKKELQKGLAAINKYGLEFIVPNPQTIQDPEAGISLDSEYTSAITDQLIYNNKTHVFKASDIIKNLGFDYYGKELDGEYKIRITAPYYNAQGQKTTRDVDISVPKDKSLKTVREEVMKMIFAQIAENRRIEQKMSTNQ